MISELSDDEILDYLMNSEFEGDFSPQEARQLMRKWKYFYRVLYGNLERIKDTKENEIRNLRSEVEILKASLTLAQMERLESQTELDQISKRKLSWKERLTGRIKTENKKNI